MSDIRDDMVLRLSDSVAWVRPFEGFIFLCGGPVNASTAYPESVRDALLRLVGAGPLVGRVRLAEDFQDWAADGHYKDLLTFEEHLAELSDVVVLILESAGSLAELGLFTASPLFREKLAVYISTHHFHQPSFIRHGPIKHLELSQNDAEVFPWLRSEMGREYLDKEWLRHSGSELLASLQERLHRKSGEARFDAERWLHRALLVCHLIWLMSALTISEISEYSSLFGVKLSDEELRQMLFILGRLELVSVVARSRSRFYVTKRESDFIRWGAAKPFVDLERFQMDVVRYYEQADKRRFRAIQEARA